ncbi:tyrosine-type recombinase/integrase [Streptosporangium sp. NPDC023963]|uniref:tyrosine-type recombinase/integrase n=1 Tax=Streptosporangium sp. NPDC023963 TaxID=3155608 RepID=UPI0034477D50
MEMTSESAGTVERHACPRCAVPAGSVCRTQGGKVASKYHTARFVLVPALREVLEVAVPADRLPGRPWMKGPPLQAAVAEVSDTAIRIGYARCSTAQQELASQIEAAVTAWRKHMMGARRSPATINQALAAVTLLYAQVGLRIDVTGDVVLTARTGHVRLHGKGDEVRTVPLPPIAREHLAAWLDARVGDETAGEGTGVPLWCGQRGRLTDSGITQIIVAIGQDAGLPGLRPHRLRYTYATRLRQGGADAAQVQALLGHTSLETTARYFRAGPAEQAAVVDRVFT